MATVTWNVSKDADVLSPNLGNGKCGHLPIGLAAGQLFRAVVGFSYSFSGMVSITSAVLHMKTTNQFHVAFGSGPTVLVQRITESWSEGSTGSDELWHSGNSTTYANIPTRTSSNQATWNVTTSENTFDTVDITDLIIDAFNNGTFYGLHLRASNESSSSDTTEFYAREGGSANDAYIVVTYTTNNPPDVPAGLAPVSDITVNSTSPTFTGTFSDPDPGDTMTGVQVIVYYDDGATLLWDSGALSQTGSTFSVAYAGTALAGNNFYRWKARTKDNSGAWGAYSSVQRFKSNSIPNAPIISLSQTPTSDIKTLTPTFNYTHSDPDVTDSAMYAFRLILEKSDGTGVWDSGDSVVTPTTSRSLTYGGPALNWQTGYRWRVRTQDSNAAWGAYSTNATFTTHTTGIPIGLNPTGGATASSTTPTLVGSRATSADLLTSASIEVYASNGTTLIWSSGSFSVGVTSAGFTKQVGTTLTANTTYKWRAQVTSSVGGTSAFSALQTFITPDVTLPSGTTPVGSGVTPVTNLPFTFIRATNFNRHEFFLYSDAAGTTQVTSDTPSSYGATGTKTFTYSGTLSWNTTYWWKVRVSSDGGTNYSPFTSLIQFTTDAAGVPTLNAPVAGSWLGAPERVDFFDSTTGITNGTSAATSIDTAVKQTGRGSLKIVLTTLANGSTSLTYRTVAKDLSKYGKQTPIKLYIQTSSLTNVSTVRLRISTDASNYVEYDVKPSGTGSWEQKTGTLGTPTATTGTMNWASVTRVGLAVTASGGTVTGNFFIDDLEFDASAPSFDGTTFSSESITTYRILIWSDSAGTSSVWDSGEVAGSSTTFSKLYNGSVTLTKGATYYWQARYTKSTGPTGAYSPLTPFLVNGDPTVPSAMDPVIDYVLPDSTTPRFKGTFEDSEKSARGDSPTIFEVEVYRNSDSVLVYNLLDDAGLVGGQNTVANGDSGLLVTTGAANPIVYDTVYKYRMRYHDLMGAVGSWSSYVTFKPSHSPVTTILVPSEGSNVSSPSFTISWSISSASSKGQNSYQVQVTRSSDSVLLYDTGQIFSSDAFFVFPSGYLVNNTDYRISVMTWDTDALPSAWDTNNITTSWTAPDPMAVFSATDDPVQSAVIIEWETSNLSSVDFAFYQIYRKLSTDTNWTVLASIASEGTIQYLDYFTANSVAYDYKMTQFKKVPGDVNLESGDSDIATAILDSDSWVVIGADRSLSHIFELPVVAGPFLEPVQQETFEPLGTSRKVIIRGKVLGAEGNLQMKWATDERDVALPQLTYIKSTAGPHILKSPFGDLWQVEFSGPNKDYEAGGHITVTMTWTEIV